MVGRPLQGGCRKIILKNPQWLSYISTYASFEGYIAAILNTVNVEARKTSVNDASDEGIIRWKRWFLDNAADDVHAIHSKRRKSRCRKKSRVIIIIPYYIVIAELQQVI